MVKQIKPNWRISGEISIPPSKSYTQRALACALISNQQTILTGVGRSEDELAALGIISNCGCEVAFKNQQLIIASNEHWKKKELNVRCKESGLASRMFTPILANCSENVTIEGSGSLLSRPMHFLENVLPELSVNIQSNQGKLPIELKGPLKPKSMVLDGSMSSQFITGMIYAYVASPLLKNEVLEVENPKSIPYIELTLDVLSKFGVNLKFENQRIQFNGPYSLQSCELQIEGDWSSASFFLVLGAIQGEVCVSNLQLNSKQADKAILNALESYGALIEYTEQSVTVRKHKANAFEFDATHCPDLFPPLAVLAAYANKPSRIKGVHRLASKESDRATVLQKEFKKMGVSIRIEDDWMIVHPVLFTQAAKINPHRDHRIAMAAAILASRSTGTTSIVNPDVVNKSFPTFYELLNSMKEEKNYSIH